MSDERKPLTCKDCPYWDDKQLRDSVKSIGYCRINHPRSGVSSERDFPVTWDDDWCYAIRPELEERLSEIVRGASGKR